MIPMAESDVYDDCLVITRTVTMRIKARKEFTGLVITTTTTTNLITTILSWYV